MVVISTGAAAPVLSCSEASSQSPQRRDGRKGFTVGKLVTACAGAIFIHVSTFGLVNISGKSAAELWKRWKDCLSFSD